MILSCSHSFCLFFPYFFLTCDLDVVGGDHVASAVHPAIPGAGVPGLQGAHPQAVGGCVQPDAGGVNEGCGPQLRGVHCHPGVLDCRQGGAGPEEKKVVMKIDLYFFVKIKKMFLQCQKGEKTVYFRQNLNYLDHKK